MYNNRENDTRLYAPIGGVEKSMSNMTGLYYML